jgi:hypothetical protein
MAIHPSPRLAILLSLMHLLAAFAAYAAPLPVSFGLWLAASVSLAYHLARDALLLSPASWCSLTVADGQATVVTRGGTELAGAVAGGSVATPFFVVLRFTPEGGRGSVARAIFPDALENDAYRELCVRLRHP